MIEKKVNNIIWRKNTILLQAFFVGFSGLIVGKEKRCFVKLISWKEKWWREWWCHLYQSAKTGIDELWGDLTICNNIFEYFDLWTEI